MPMTRPSVTTSIIYVIELSQQFLQQLPFFSSQISLQLHFIFQGADFVCHTHDHYRQCTYLLALYKLNAD